MEVGDAAGADEGDAEVGAHRGTPSKWVMGRKK
jgi:hypothetical protein